MKTNQTRFVRPAEYERAVYIKRTWMLTAIELTAMNEIEANYIAGERVEYCFFDTLRELIDKYGL